MSQNQVHPSSQPRDEQSGFDSSGVVDDVTMKHLQKGFIDENTIPIGIGFQNNTIPPSTSPSPNNIHPPHTVVTSPTSVIQSESAHSNSNTTDTSDSGFSITNHAMNLLCNMVISLEDRTATKGWKLYLFHLVVHAFIIWTQLFIPTLRDFYWGQYGSYVFQVLNFPTTLLFDKVSYVGAIVLACVTMALTLLNLALLCLALRFTMKPSKYFNKLKKLIRLSSWTMRILSLLMVYILVGFLDCNISEQISVNSFSDIGSDDGISSSKIVLAPLKRFSNVGCVGSSNVTMIVVSCIGICLLVFICYPFSELILANSNAQSQIPLISENSFVTLLVGECSLIQLIVTCIVPAPYAYASAAFNLLSSLFLCGVVFYNVPFLRRYDNSLYFGACCGRVGASIGSLVASTVVSLVFSSNNSQLTAMDIDSIKGGFVGMTIALIIVAFMIGSIFMELYLMIQQKRMRKHLIDFLGRSRYDTEMIEKNFLYIVEKIATSLYAEMEESKRLSMFRLFFKLSLKRTSSETYFTDNYFTDLDITMALVKGVAQQKAFSDISLLILASMIIQVKWQGDANCSIFSQSLLKRALKQRPNIMEKLLIQERMKESETMSQFNNSLFEVTSQIETLETNQSALIALHRDFWKECANEHLNYEALENINRSIFSLSSECKTTLTNLMFTYPNNKTILRLNANFVENFEFNKDLAQLMYAEASAIEEEEMKRRRPSVKLQHQQPSPQFYRSGAGNNSGLLYSNRVLPYAAETSFSKYEINSNKEESVADFGDKEENLIDNNHQDDLESSAFDNPQIKKETIFRRAISTSRSHKCANLTLLLYFLFSLCVLLTSLGLSVKYSQSVMFPIPFVQQVCFPSVLPYSIVRNTRATQNWLNIFYLFGYTWPSTNDGFPTISKAAYVSEYTQKFAYYQEIFNSLLRVGQGSVFSDDIYTEYSATKYQIYFPNEVISSTSGISTYTGAYSLKNTSIYEITNIMIKFTDRLRSAYPIDTINRIEALDIRNASTWATRQTLLDRLARSLFFDPVRDYNFMFIWINYDIITSAYDSFCRAYLDRSAKVNVDSMNEFVIYLSVVAGVFVITSGLFLVFVISELSFLRKVVKIFESQIQKDTVGKIFHKLSKKTECEDVHHVKSLSMNRVDPKWIILPLSFLVTTCVCVCISLMFVESNLNSTNSSSFMKKVRVAAQASRDVERASLDIGELLTYFGASEITRSNSTLASTFNRTVNFGDYRMLKNNDFNIIFSRALKRAQDVSRRFSSLVYGDSASGTASVIGAYPNVDMLIKVGMENCTDFMIKNNVTLTFSSHLLYCRGMEQVLSDFVSMVPQVGTNSRRSYELQQLALRNMTLLSPVRIAMEHYSLLRMAGPLVTKFTNFIREYVKATSEPSYYLVIITAIVGIGLSISTFFGVWNMFSNYWQQIHTLRLMFNYLPVELLETNEKVKEFIMNHSVKLSTTRKKKRKTHHERNENGLENLKIIFNSSVEGAVICSSDQNAEIEFFNTSGLRMLGIKMIDILGKSLYEIFDSSQRDEIKRKTEIMAQKAKQTSLKSQNTNNSSTTNLLHANNQLCECVEVDCIRKNQSKFPAKFNIHVVNLEGRNTPSIVATFKDITSEKKQSILLNEEKQKSENLLKNILPTSVANKLKTGGDTFIAESLDDVTCFFSDMVGFTRISSKLNATDLVLMLNTIVNGFDSLIEKYDLEKIKTIGDAYFCVGGLHDSLSDHPERVLRFAIDTFGVIHQYNQTIQQEQHKETNEEKQKELLNIRVGINTGAVVAGVIGTKKFAYDLWGDTINTASRMESTSLPGRVQLSRSTYERVYDLGYEFEERLVDVKGKGKMQSYLLKANHHTNPLPEHIHN